MSLAPFNMYMISQHAWGTHCVHVVGKKLSMSPLECVCISLHSLSIFSTHYNFLWFLQDECIMTHDKVCKPFVQIQKVLDMVSIGSSILFHTKSRLATCLSRECVQLTHEPHQIKGVLLWYYGITSDFHRIHSTPERFAHALAQNLSQDFVILPEVHFPTCTTFYSTPFQTERYSWSSSFTVIHTFHIKFQPTPWADGILYISYTLDERGTTGMRHTRCSPYGYPRYIFDERGVHGHLQIR